MTDDNDRNREAILLKRLQLRTDELTAGYLLVTASLMVLFREQVAHLPLFLGLHLTTAALLLWLRSLSSPSMCFWKFLHDSGIRSWFFRCCTRRSSSWLRPLGTGG